VSILAVGILGFAIHPCSDLKGISPTPEARVQFVNRPSFDRNGTLGLRSVANDDWSITVRFDFPPRATTQRMTIPVWNPTQAPITGTAFLYCRTGNGNVGFQLDPGWNVLLIDKLRAGSTLVWSELKRVDFYLNSPRNQQALDRSQGLLPVEIDALNINPMGPPVFTCSWDDGQRSSLTHGWPVIQQFPRIPHTFNVVKSWIEAGYRLGLDEAQTLRLHELDFLWSTGQIKFGNHSDRHLRYESGIDPDYTAPTAWSQVVGIRSGSGRFRIKLGNSRTGHLPGNATQRAVEDELAKIVGAGKVVVRTTGSPTLTPSFGFRVEFTSPQPRITVETTEGNLVAYAGPAISVDKIAQAYRQNRDYLVLNGWYSSDVDTVAYPEGSFGPNVRQAMQSSNVTYGRLMTRKNGQALMLQPLFRLDPYQVPAINVSAAGVAETLAAIDQCMAVGGYLNLMFHDVNRTGATEGNTINRDDLYTVLNYLNTKIDQGARVLTQGEFVDWYKWTAIRQARGDGTRPIGGNGTGGTGGGTDDR